MGRPKACERSKRIACLFANAVSCNRVDDRDGNRIDCKGPQSIFSLLATCLPELVRDSKDLHPANRSGVSEVELNKFLTSSGFLACRERHRISSSTITKWSKGIKRWSNRRWIDPRKPGDLFLLNARMAELHQAFPETRSVSISETVQVLLVLTSQNSSSQPFAQQYVAAQNKASDVDSNQDSEDGQDVCVKRKLSELPSISESESQIRVGSAQVESVLSDSRKMFRCNKPEFVEDGSSRIVLAEMRREQGSCLPALKHCFQNEPFWDRTSTYFGAAGGTVASCGGEGCVQPVSAILCDRSPGERALDPWHHAGSGSFSCHLRGDVRPAALGGSPSLVQLCAGGAEEEEEAQLSRLSGEASSIMALVNRFYSYVPGQSNRSIDDMLHTNHLGPLALPVADGDADGVDALAHGAHGPWDGPLGVRAARRDQWAQVQVGPAALRGGRSGLLSVGRVWAVPRPVVGASRCLRFHNLGGTRAPTFPGCPPWARVILNYCYAWGWSEASLVSVFTHLPPDVLDAIKLAFYSLMVLVRAKYGMSGGEARLLALLDPARGGDVDEPWMLTDSEDQKEVLSEYDRAGLGICRRTYEPVTSRTTEFYCNPVHAAMTNLPVEELLARIGHNDLPLAFSEVDYLCIVLDSAFNFFSPSNTQCIRWAWPGAEPQLFKRRFITVSDHQGVSYQVYSFKTALTAEQFDAAYAAEPARSSCYARLRAAIGDTRSGRELLRDWRADRLVTIKSLVQTADGRARLSRLGREALRVFEPHIAAARALCPAAMPCETT